MKGKDKNLLAFGIFNVISVIPFLFLAMVVAFKIFALVDIKATVILCLLIIFLSPISCIIGIVRGIRSRKNPGTCAQACAILSVIGIFLFAVVAGYLWWRSGIS